MDTIRISWTLRGEAETAYVVNGEPVGGGFEAILEIIRQNPLAQIILELGPMAGGGGRSVRSMLPFSSRYAEFAEALGGRDAVMEMQ